MRYEDILGSEGVPNLYISDISVYGNMKSSNSKTTIEVCFLLHNSLNSRGRPVFKQENYDISVDFVLNDEVSLQLLKQETVMSIEKTEAWKTLTKEGVIQSHVVGIDQRFPRLSKRAVTPMYIKKKFTFDSKHKDIAVFARIHRQGTKLCGPIACERIIIKGKVANNSFVYKIKGTDTVWTGPVHYHETNREYMAGSFHKNQAHPALDRVSYQFSKIKDYTDDGTRTEEIVLKKQKNVLSYMFSKPLHSQTENGNLNFMFAVDTKEMLLRSSKYSAILSNFDKETFDRVSENVKIKRLSVFSKKGDHENYMPVISSRERTKKLRTNVRRLRGQTEPYAFIEEMILDESPNVRHIAFNLKEKTSKGIKIKVEIDDPVERFLTTFKKDVEISSRKIKSLETLYYKQGLFDRKMNRFNNSMLGQRYDSKTNLWYSIIETYTHLLKLTTSMKQSEISKEVKKIFSYISPRTCTPQSLSHFKALYSDLFARFIKLYPITNNTTNTRPTGRKRTTNNQNSVFEKTYKINHRSTKLKMSFIMQQEDPHRVPIFTHQEFKQMLQNEKQKIINNDDLDLSSIEANQNIRGAAQRRNSDEMYLSPLFLKNGTDMLMYQNLSNLQEKQLEEITIMEGPNWSGLFGSKITATVIDEEIDTAFKDILGDNSNFQSTPLEFERERRRRSKPNSLLTRGIKKMNKKNSNTSLEIIKKFDSSTPNNIFDNKNSEQVSVMPLHHKVLSSRGNILPIRLSKNDFLSKEIYKRDLAFFTLRKIMVYEEYNSDQNSNKIIGDPLLVEMNSEFSTNLSKPLFCSLEQYEDPSVHNEDNKFKSFKEYNSFFIVVPNNYKYTKNINSQGQQSNQVLSSMLSEYRRMDLDRIEFSKNTSPIEPSFRKNTASNSQRTERTVSDGETSQRRSGRRNQRSQNRQQRQNQRNEQRQQRTRSTGNNQNRQQRTRSTRNNTMRNRRSNNVY